MTRLLTAANFVMPPGRPLNATPRYLMSDAQLAAIGQAEIDAGDYIEGEELDAFLDSLTLDADKVR